MPLIYLIISVVALLAAACIPPVAGEEEPSASPGPPFDFDQYRWEHRLLLLMAPSPDDARYRDQIDRLQGTAPAATERDMLFIHVFGATPGSVAAPDGTVLQTLSAVEIEESRGRGSVCAAAHRKDGGVKHREAAAVHSWAIFDQIDTMPMRRLVIPSV